MKTQRPVSLRSLSCVAKLWSWTLLWYLYRAAHVAWRLNITSTKSGVSSFRRNMARHWTIIFRRGTVPFLWSLPSKLAWGS